MKGISIVFGRLLKISGLFISFAIAITSSGTSQEIIISTFDSGNESWEVDGGSMYYSSSAGNPGGFIEFEDQQDGAGGFSAPGKFLGDLSAYNNGTLSFDMLNTNDNGREILWGYGAVRISSQFLWAEKNVLPDTIFNSWTRFSIPMTAADWGVTESAWDSILSGVTSIRIQMDAQWDYYDRTGLDNFALFPNTLDVDQDTRLNMISGYSLFQNYPNPFNPITSIVFDIPKSGHTKIEIYNIAGQLIKVLVDEFRSAGRNTVDWNGTNSYGQTVSTGFYLCHIQAEEYSQVIKMQFLR